jgi:hypothetical protein
MVAVGWSGYFVARDGLYPVALVNFSVITDQALNNTFKAAMAYYGKLKKPETSREEFEKEIKRATLEKIIEHKIILENVNLADVEDQLASLISKNKDLEKGVLFAFGLSMKNFLNLVLRPQAALEILNKSLKDKNENLDKWLIIKKKSAKVFILKGFRWNGESVENK